MNKEKYLKWLQDKINKLASEEKFEDKESNIYLLGAIDTLIELKLQIVKGKFD